MQHSIQDHPFIYLIVGEFPTMLLENRGAVYSGLSYEGFKLGVEDGTLPHQFDKQFVHVLPALAFLLNLPRGPFDLIDTTKDVKIFGESIWSSHGIYLLSRHVLGVRELLPITAIVSERSCLGLVESKFASLLTRPLIYTLEDLDRSTVRKAWRDISRRTFGSDASYCREVAAPELRLDRIATQLAKKFRIPGSKAPHLEPMNIAFLGVAPRYLRLLKRLLRIGGLKPAASSQDAEIERDVVSVMLAHGSLQNDMNRKSAFGKAVSPKAFSLLHKLESHLALDRPSSQKVWKLLRQLGKEGRAMASGDLLADMDRAPDLRILSNFPYGLVSLDKSREPLHAEKPVSHIRISSLTGSLSHVIRPVYSRKTREGLRVLIAELTEADDPVGIECRKVHARFKEIFEGTKSTLRIEDIASIDALNAVLEEDSYDVLIISAHGKKYPGFAGVLCKKEMMTGAELKTCTPLVFLMCCHSTPLGTGTAGILDELINVGFVAAVTTMAPINVWRSSFFLESVLIAMLHVSEARMSIDFASLWPGALNAAKVYDVVFSLRRFRQRWRSCEATRQIIHDLVRRISLSAQEGEARDYSRIIGDISEAFREAKRPMPWLDRLKPESIIPESYNYLLFGQPERFVLGGV